jgi:hypothetical protein
MLSFASKGARQSRMAEVSLSLTKLQTEIENAESTKIGAELKVRQAMKHFSHHNTCKLQLRGAQVMSYAARVSPDTAPWPSGVWFKSCAQKSAARSE